MKLIKRIIFILVLLIIPKVKAESLDVYLFHSNVCSHCMKEIEWLESIKDEYDFKAVYL